MTKQLDASPIVGLDDQLIAAGDSVVSTSTQGALHTGRYLGHVEVSREDGNQYQHWVGHDYVRARLYYHDGQRKRHINFSDWIPKGQPISTDRMIKR